MKYKVEITVTARPNIEAANSDKTGIEVVRTTNKVVYDAIERAMNTVTNKGREDVGIVAFSIEKVRNEC